MTTKAEIQDLLRFLAQDAKIPLPVAMGKIKDLQTASLTSAALLAKSDAKALSGIFNDEKVGKQVLNAAKRISKKRSSTEATATTPSKRTKKPSGEEPMTPAAIEESLTLPAIDADDDLMSKTLLHTNRAPLVLAFAVTLLQYTMPNQPLSSRLSLAQAVVSANSRSKAVSIGLESGPSAEDDGWGQGQPQAQVMGREIRVLKRWGYDPLEGASGQHEEAKGVQKSPADSGSKDAATPNIGDEERDPALWGMDLEALRSSNTLASSGSRGESITRLPIHTAESARAYLLKAFASAPLTDTEIGKPPPKKSAAAVNAEKERNLALLLCSLERLIGSWAPFLDKQELDRRAWSWYVNVRPDVQNGPAGWGGKGEVKLASILNLQRKG